MKNYLWMNRAKKRLVVIQMHKPGIVCLHQRNKLLLYKLKVTLFILLNRMVSSPENAPKGMLNRVGHSQSKWKRQVKEQRRNIFDNHTMLN